MAAAIASPQDAAPLADWLFAVSEGNAYILTELLRFARQNGLLDAAGHLNAAALPEGPVVPHTVFSLIQSRLDSLSDETRRVLGAAVAQGREFEFAVVARAAGLSDAAALDALDELQAAGLIQAREGGWFRFDHPLTMEVAYQEIGDLRHRRMHHRVAEALEQLHLDQLDDVAGQLAWHFFEGNAPERAVRYALQGARNAARLAAWDETIQLYQLALQGLNGSARLPAMVDLGHAHVSAGHFARASEVFRDALRLAASLGAAPQQTDAIHLTLARALLPQARFAEVIELAAEVARSPVLETAVMAETAWGAALSVEGADLAAAAEHLQRASELCVAGRGLDPALLAHIQFELGSVAAQQGDLETAVTYYRKALATSDVPGDHALEQRILSYNNLAYHLHLLGDPTADQYARQGVELAQEKGQLGLLPFLYSTQGEIALASGDVEAAEACFRAGLELAQRFSIPERIAGMTANLGLVAVQRGQKDLAIHHLSEALGLADSLGSRHLAAQIRLWLAPLLPPGPARIRLAEARAFAEATGRKRLLDEVARIQAGLS
jgi:tetratricopeptide (TPR) repeat protein